MTTPPLTPAQLAAQPQLYSQRTRPLRFRLWRLWRSLPCRLGLRAHWWVVRHPGGRTSTLLAVLAHETHGILVPGAVVVCLYCGATAPEAP